MPNPLTPISIAALKPRSKRYEISDPGCAGLRVVVFPSRRKSFILRFRFRGLQRKLTLGPCLTERGVAESDTTPELDTPLSLAAARQLAAKALREAKAGNDPSAAKQRTRQQELAAESDTLQAITEKYLRMEGPRLRTFTQRKADLDLICGGVLGRLPVAEVKRTQYTNIFDDIAEKRGPVRSDRCRSALKTLLNWHANRSDFISPLVRGGGRRASKARDRVLSDDELRALWRAAGEDTTLFCNYVRFVLLTATRRNEASGLRRSELIEGGGWLIPAHRYKSNRDMLIPLSAAAQKIIASMPDRGDLVFSGDGARPLGSFGERKQTLDAACGVTGWTLHDLRRTARTLMSRREAGITPDIAERCLGHSILGVRGVYDRFEYRDEKAAAFEALARLISRIVDPPGDDVVVQISEKARRK